MVSFNRRRMENDSGFDGLISQLIKRSTLAPIKSEHGNQCMLVDMSDCSKDFVSGSENFFDGSDFFQIRVRGTDYYVEVINADSFMEAYQKSIYCLQAKKT